MNATSENGTRRIVSRGIVGVAMLCLVPLTAQAFGRGGGHRPDPDRATARLAEELDLTAEQRDQVKAALEADFAEREKMREAHRNEMDALRDQTHESLAAVLTPEQARKLDQLREERRGRREDRQGRDRDGGCDQWPKHRRCAKGSTD